MSQRRRWLGLGLALIPVGGAWALAQDGGPSPTTTTPSVMVPEQVSVARHVVPFAFSGDAASATVWATGRTRAASTPQVGGNADPPAENADAATVLVAGTITAGDRPTGWARAAPPIDRDGNPLALGAWRLEDGVSAATSLAATATGDALHAGAGTTAGAAAVLVRITEGAGSRAAVLARTSDGRFRELPAPPVALDGPGTAVTPMDTFDITLPDAAPAPPADRGRTGVVLAPEGSSGAVVWDGTAWTVEPWQAADGTPLGAQTALAVGATDDGDAVALFAGDPTGPTADRVTLARRDRTTNSFRSMAISGAPLLGGALPASVTAIRLVAAPGQPLTVGDGHWWVDLRVERGSDPVTSATVHLVPGGDADRLKAQATGAWCQPVLASDTGCTRELGFEFAVTRGYRSEVFASAASPSGPEPAFGRRVITSPVIPEATGTASVREASASGGYLALDGERFALRSGVGDDGDDGSQAAAVGRGGVVLLGGRRTIGRLMTARGGELAAYDATVPGLNEAHVDVALSPPGTPTEIAGAIQLSAGGGALLQRATDPWTVGTTNATQTSLPDGQQRWITAVAWDAPGSIVTAGRGGLVLGDALTPLTGSSTSTGGAGVLVEASRGLDLLDVATSGTDGWAVGRAGALMRRSDGEWSKRTLPVPLAAATMIQVALSGDEALIASDQGLLVGAASGEVSADIALAALLAADGRGSGVATVAGLPDGGAVVDGRYVRESQGGPWLRLASPAEGDTAALALWRVASATEGARLVEADGNVRGSTLAVAASIADVPRPAYGPPLPAQGDADAGPADPIEGPPLVTDGRPAVLEADGWRDLLGAPLHRSRGRDLARPSPPITAFAVNADGSGWASGGVGTFLNFVDPRTFPTEIPSSIEFAMGGEVGRVPARAPIVRAEPGAQPATGAGVRIFVGGHPACLSECAGRDDVGLAPDENLRQALGHVRDMTDPADGPAVAIIGGGRTGAGTTPSTAALAQYSELLRSTPGITVAAVLGSGDAPNIAARLRFRARMAPFFHRTAEPGGVIPVTSPTAPVDDPGSDAVAYAFDVPARGFESPARVVVIDNAGGTLRGGADGDQARWLDEVLADAALRGVQPIVVGAARLDEGRDRADDRAAQLDLLTRRGVKVYVATEGTDDPTSPAFGARIAAETLTVSGQAIRHIRSAGLGHAVSTFSITGAAGESDEEALRESRSGWGYVGLLALKVVPGQPVDESIAPVFDRAQAAPILGERGRADFVFPLLFNGGSAGYRAVNPLNVAAGEQDVRSVSFVDVSTSFCRFVPDAAECANQLPIDATFRVANPEIATFVRSRTRRSGSGSGPPEIVLDAAGNPIIDPRSSVLCVTGVGETTVTITASGRTAVLPLKATEPQTAIPTSGRAPCGFLSPPPPPAPAPAPAPTPAPAVPAPVSPLVPELPSPEPKPAPKPAPKPSPTPAPIVIAPVLGASPVVLPDASSPAVTLKPKPTPPAPVPPPSGLSPSFQPTPQVQQVFSAATQKQREEQLAREGSLQRAAVYERPADPAPVGALLLGGVGLLLTVGAGGAVVGSRRRAATAAARAHGITR